MRNLEQLVDETLQSFNGVERPSSNPYLYTRIRQRMEKRANPVSYQRRLMPVLALALVLFISLNVLSYVRLGSNSATSVSSSGSASGIEGFANEYNLSEKTGI